MACLPFLRRDRGEPGTREATRRLSARDLPLRADALQVDAANPGAPGRPRTYPGHQEPDRSAREAALDDTDPIVAAVLAGHLSYDDLTDAQQAAVRDAWERLDAAAIAELDFTLNP